MEILFRHNTKYFDISYIKTNNDIIDTILTVTKYLIELNNIIYKLYNCVTNKDIIDIVPYYAINTLLYEIIHSIETYTYNDMLAVIDTFFTIVIDYIIFNNNVYGNNGNRINLLTTEGLQHKSFDDIENYYNSIKITTFDDIYEIIKYNMREITHNDNVRYDNNLIHDYYNKGIQLLNELNTIGITKYINNNNTLKNINYNKLIKQIEHELDTKNIKMNVLTMRIKRQLQQLKNKPINIYHNKTHYIALILDNIYIKYKQQIDKYRSKIINAHKKYYINMPTIPKDIEGFNIIIPTIQKTPPHINSNDCVIKYVIYLLYIIIYNGPMRRINKIHNISSKMYGYILILKLFNNIYDKSEILNSTTAIARTTNIVSTTSNIISKISYNEIYNIIYKLIFNKILQCFNVINNVIDVISNILKMCDINIIVNKRILFDTINFDKILYINENIDNIASTYDANETHLFDNIIGNYTIIGGIIENKKTKKILFFAYMNYTYFLYTEFNIKNDKIVVASLKTLQTYYILHIGVYMITTNVISEYNSYSSNNNISIRKTSHSNNNSNNNSNNIFVPLY